MTRARVFRITVAFWSFILGNSLFVFSDEPAMRAHFINVGQADSILLEFPCGAALIDAGSQDEEHRDKLVAYLNAFFTNRPDLNKTLQVVYVTHSHEDHANAMKAVVNNFKVKNYVDDGVVDGSGAVYLRWIRQVAPEKHIAVCEVLDDQVTNLAHRHGLTNNIIDPISCDKCDPRIVILSGGHKQYDKKKLNNESLVIRVDFGHSSFLFPGDLERKGIASLVDYYEDTEMLHADVLKVGHHGSMNATNKDLLEEALPQIAVITVGPWDFGKGDSNPFNTFHYGHPRATVLDLLSQYIDGRRSQPIEVMAADKAQSFHRYTVNKRIYATAWDGNVVVRGDLAGNYRTTANNIADTFAAMPPAAKASHRAALMARSAPTLNGSRVDHQPAESPLPGSIAAAKRAAVPYTMQSRLGANLYMQTAAEYRACCLQVYRTATMRLEMMLAATKPRPAKSAVVMDLDETVLDNGAFESFLYENSLEYSDDLWAKYERDCPNAVCLVPGAKQFIRNAEAMGVAVVYISNRLEENQPSTIAALKRLEINTQGIEGRLLLKKKGESSGKAARREAVAARYNVLCYFGDNLRDFSESFAAPTLPSTSGDDVFSKAIQGRLRQVDDAECHWGVDWFMLPNPGYGEWEKLVSDAPVRRLRPSGMKAPVPQRP